jgi:hypothetical protein
MIARAAFFVSGMNGRRLCVRPPDIEKHRCFDTAHDKLRARYGRKAIYFGSVQERAAIKPS